MNDIKYFLKNIIRKRGHIRQYHPRKLENPGNIIMPHLNSSWRGLELIIKDILDRFEIGRQTCIEFGVEYGYSTIAFSNYFSKVIGIDTFEGDEHTGKRQSHFEETKKRLSEYPNIHLIKSDYKDWIQKDTAMYDFAHVDIVHTYNDTYTCGLWAAQHSQCVIFHDTESFLETRKAVIDIARVTGKELYNYADCYGLGIVVASKRN